MVEPYRKHFIPGFDFLRTKVLEVGALALNISGAGPSVFALCENMTLASPAKFGEVIEKATGHWPEIPDALRERMSSPKVYEIMDASAPTLKDYILSL